MIHYYYGFGKGKTSSAIGAGMRAKGAGMSVSLYQFFKDNKSSELKVLPFDIYKSPESLPFNVGKEYQTWVDKAMESIKNCKSDMIILDEFADAIPKFVKLDKEMFSSEKEYIITGHNFNSDLAEIADYVTNFQKEKHPYDKGIGARLGIEY